MKKRKKRCEYNINKTLGYLPIKECSRKAKYEVSIEHTETGKEYVALFCKQHWKMVMTCGNVSEVSRKL